jgi:hypothetical protein
LIFAGLAKEQVGKAGANTTLPYSAEEDAKEQDE